MKMSTKFYLRFVYFYYLLLSETWIESDKLFIEWEYWLHNWALKMTAAIYKSFRNNKSFNQGLEMRDYQINKEWDCTTF